MDIQILRSGDNYIYLLISGTSVAVIDPGTAGPVLRTLDKLDMELDQIFITHNHHDHTGGCNALQHRHGCEIMKPENLCAGDMLTLGSVKFRILSVPGHTSEDVAYYSESEKALFTGDTLFIASCGRVFSGDYDAMWKSMQKLRALPDDTRVYCGHNYTLDNLQFAQHCEPDNKRVDEKIAEIRDCAKTGAPTVPSTIGDEKLTNPFFRCDLEEFQRAAGLECASAEGHFAEIRQRKDKW